MAVMTLWGVHGRLRRTEIRKDSRVSCYDFGTFEGFDLSRRDTTSALFKVSPPLSRPFSSGSSIRTFIMESNETGELDVSVRLIPVVLVGCIGGSGLYHLDNLTPM